MSSSPLPAAREPRAASIAAGAPLAVDPAGPPIDGAGLPVPRRRWQMRVSDRIGMGTFSVASVSAYLLWSVIQGVDDMRQDLRNVADQQRIGVVTLERIQGAQREQQERYSAHEVQEVARFAEFDSRLGLQRRSQEDIERAERDHEQRLRVLETDGPRSKRPAQ